MKSRVTLAGGEIQRFAERDLRHEGLNPALVARAME
jgi:hypothetical protein